MSTIAELKDNQDTLFDLIGKCVRRWLFQWVAAGFAGSLVLILLGMYSISCTANECKSGLVSDQKLHSIEYHNLKDQITEMKASFKEDIARLNKNFDALLARLHAKGTIDLPCPPSMGFLDEGN